MKKQRAARASQDRTSHQSHHVLGVVEAEKGASRSRAAREWRQRGPLAVLMAEATNVRAQARACLALPPARPRSKDALAALQGHPPPARPGLLQERLTQGWGAGSGRCTPRVPGSRGHAEDTTANSPARRRGHGTGRRAAARSRASWQRAPGTAVAAGQGGPPVPLTPAGSVR